MMISFAAATHAGAVRRINEDAFLVSSLDGDEARVNLLRPTLGEGPATFLAAVADGLGGAVSGEVASREGLASFALCMFSFWARFPALASEAGLVQALGRAAREASAALLRYSEADPALRGMSATLAAVAVWDGGAYLCQVGDCRVYLYRALQLTLLTPPRTGGSGGRKGLITDALGVPMPVEPALARLDLRRGDRILVCSDGLHGILAEARIQHVLAMGQSLKRTSEQLVQEALSANGADDTTALLLSFDDASLPLPRLNEKIRLTRAAGRRTGFLGRLLAALPWRGRG